MSSVIKMPMTSYALTQSLVGIVPQTIPLGITRGNLIWGETSEKKFGIAPALSIPNVFSPKVYPNASQLEVNHGPKAHLPTDAFINAFRFSERYVPSTASPQKQAVGVLQKEIDSVASSVKDVMSLLAWRNHTLPTIEETFVTAKDALESQPQDDFSSFRIGALFLMMPDARFGRALVDLFNESIAVLTKRGNYASAGIISELLAESYEALLLDANKNTQGINQFEEIHVSPERAQDIINHFRTLAAYSALKCTRGNNIITESEISSAYYGLKQTGGCSTTADREMMLRAIYNGHFESNKNCIVTLIHNLAQNTYVKGNESSVAELRIRAAYYICAENPTEIYNPEAILTHLEEARALLEITEDPRLNELEEIIQDFLARRNRRSRYLQF